jgi:hypothetical protein
MGNRTERIRIRCESNVQRKFKVMVALYGFKTQEDAILAMMDNYEKNVQPGGRRIKWG